MKISFNRNELVDVLSKVQGLTGRKSNLAITETVLIKALDSGITLMATDLETGFEGSYPAEVETEGIIAINAKKLYEIVRDYPNETLALNEADNRWLEIGDRKVFYHIVGMNPDDFPDVPQVEEVPFFEVDSRKLKGMIEKVLIVGGSSDEKRAHMLGVYFERLTDGDQKLIRMVSTDGSRLSLADYRFASDFDLPEGPGVLIPKKALQEINRFLEPVGNVRIGVKDNHLVVKKEAETIIVRLLEGAFPKYAEIIDRQDGYIIAVEKSNFLMTLKRMSILASDDYRAAIFDFSASLLSISAANPALGDSKEDMEIEYEGQSMKIAFNPRYFIDTVNVVKGDTVLLYLSAENRPCLVFDRDDDSFLSAIMPMRV